MLFVTVEPQLLRPISSPASRRRRTEPTKVQIAHSTDEVIGDLWMFSPRLERRKVADPLPDSRKASPGIRSVSGFRQSDWSEPRGEKHQPATPLRNSIPLAVHDAGREVISLAAQCLAEARERSRVRVRCLKTRDVLNKDVGRLETTDEWQQSE